MEKKKKRKIGVIVGVVCVAIVALIFLIIGIASNNKKLSTPTNLQVITTTTGKTYIQVDKCKDAKEYAFEIINTKTPTDKNTYTSPTYQLDATAIFNMPSTYTISCKYIGDNEQKNSDSCTKITFKATKQIATPTISFGTGEDKNKLFVETSNNFGEDVEYTITLFYTDGTIMNNNDACTIYSRDAYGTAHGYFVLNTVFQYVPKGTEYQLAVQVSQKVDQGEESYYLTSKLSQQLTYTVA